MIDWSVTPLMSLVQTFVDNVKYFEMLNTAVNVLADDEIVSFIKADLKSPTPEKLEAIDSRVQIAKQSLKESHHMLYEQAIITQYAYLEAGLRDLIKNIFIHEPSLFKDAEVGKLKVEYLTYRRHQKAGDEVLASYFMKQLEDSLPRTPYGVDKFESMLKLVGLNGAVSSEVSKLIFEQAQIRNILLHKKGVVDQLFNERCGNLGYKVGDRIKLTLDQVKAYIGADMTYISTVSERVSSLVVSYLDSIIGSIEDENRTAPSGLRNAL
jgi:hypothetical protein